jgi:hypothetical protein
MRYLVNLLSTFAMLLGGLGGFVLLEGGVGVGLWSILSGVWLGVLWWFCLLFGTVGRRRIQSSAVGCSAASISITPRCTSHAAVSGASSSRAPGSCAMPACVCG